MFVYVASGVLCALLALCDALLTVEGGNSSLQVPSPYLSHWCGCTRAVSFGRYGRAYGVHNQRFVKNDAKNEEWLELGSGMGGRGNNTHSGGLGQSPSRVQGSAPAGSGAAPRRGAGQRPAKKF